MEKKIRLGIIGCGVMSRHSHAYGMKDIASEAEVTAICDKRIYRAEEFCDNMGGDRSKILITADYKEMVDVVDAVVIVTPHHLHYEQAMFFLQHDKHVLCEKPIAITEEDCLAMVAEAKKRNLTFMCAYPVPYWEGIVKLKELLDSGKYGKVFQMSIWTEQYTGLDRGDGEAAEWGFNRKYVGGGQFFSHGCHYVDLMLRFLGEPIKGFHMGTVTGTPWMKDMGEGTSNVVIEFEGGVLGYHFGTWGARGTTHDYNIQVFTDKGFFEYDHVKNSLTYKSTLGPANETRGITEWKFMGVGKQTQYELLHFVDCLRTGKEPLTDGESSIQSLRAIWRMYEAEQKGVIADLRGLGIKKEEKIIKR